MANSASDARQSEMEIRKQLIEAGVVDVMVAVGSNFFYTVTLPCTLWFLDKARKGTDRADKTLFLDARHIYRQVDRAQRDFTPEQIALLANVVRLYRGEQVKNQDFQSFKDWQSSQLTQPQLDALSAMFTSGEYTDIPGLCKAATREEIAAQGWSLNSGRYVGVAERAQDDFDFYERIQGLHEELATLNAEARELEELISENMTKLLED